jgi:DNA replication and repair protein RecF
MDLLGKLNAVLFLPEDIALVSGSPSGRRRYLDAMLCQIDPAYCRSLSRYNQVISQRNALLRDLRERGGDHKQLGYWDDQLVENGAYMVARRRVALVILDELACNVHSDLTGGSEHLHMDYQPSIEIGEQEAVDSIAATFQAQLQVLRPREIPAGVTLAGPHRDEVRFVINGVDAGTFGSRGQQRTAALALKLAEVDLMRWETGEYPILLLDDVLSELDASRRQYLVEWLADGPQQALLTTTDLESVPTTFLMGCRLWRVQMGRLSSLRVEEG